MPHTEMPPPPPFAVVGGRSESTRRHIRGSNLLLFGRLVALGTNFLGNVLTVRYLSKSDYGAFAFGLSIAATGSSVVLLGMSRSIARFAPLYQERRDYPAMYGTLALTTGLIATFGALLLGLGMLLREPLLARFVTDPLSVALLLILIVLAPLQALDNLFQSMLAVFARPSAIFFRRYVLGPLLKLGAVLLVVTCDGSVSFLAWAYLAAALLGLTTYGPMLRTALARAGLWQHLDLRRLRLPCKDVLGFGLALVPADILVVIRPTLAVVLLEHFHGTSPVADFNAFLKVAGLNLIVLQSMKQLFLPIASRLYARGDHAGIDDLYWQTTTWISILTFPLFVPCIAMADSVALLLYGEPYVGSSGILVVLALGEYFNAAMGLNAYALQVYARVRFLVWTTALATGVGFALDLALIPGLGGLGAALATSGALILQNLLYHWGMHRSTQIELVRWKYLRVYLHLGLATLTLLAIHLLAMPLAVDLTLVALTSLGILRLHRETMDVANVFPELGKLPMLGRLLGVGGAQPAD